MWLPFIQPSVNAPGAKQKLGVWGGLTLIREAGSSEIGAHQHFSHLLSLQISGSADLDWRENVSVGSRLITPGELTLLPTGSCHAQCSVRAHDSRQDPVQLVALVNPQIIAAKSNRKVDLEENRGFRDLQLERLLLVLYDAALSQPSSPLFGDLIANAMALHLMTNYATREVALPIYRGGIPPSRLSKVLERMDADPQATIPVSDLAEAAGLSPFHFSRAFRRSTGMSPYQYLLSRKIERAKSLLAGSEKTIAEVAASLGFAQQNYFARIFRKHTGLSPNEFRHRL